jgi:hypothetical protein
VCAGSIGAASIYLIEDVEELSSILERVIKSMEAFIGAFDKDGLITEGLSYWSYGFSFYTYFSELLRERTAGKISLLEGSAKIKKIAELPQILQFTHKGYVNFSDAGEEAWSGDSGLFSRLEERTKAKGYNYSGGLNIYNDNTYRWAVMARKLFWSKNTKEIEAEVKEGNYYFEESQWLINRKISNKGVFSAFAAKGGNNDEPHNHNDLGHFILHHAGENLLIDIGSPEYVKEYFQNETRYNFLTAASFGHSVPVINHQVQSFGKDHYAKVLNYEEVSDTTFFKLDLSKAYSCKELINFNREFVWNGEKLLLEIKDSFIFNKENNEIEEAFITHVKPEILETGKLIIKTTNSSVELLYPKEMEYSTEKCFYNNHNGIKSYVFRTTFIKKTGTKENCSFKVTIK